jgi:Holliday junction resolvasome RuvABC endonuclease subunit
MPVLLGLDVQKLRLGWAAVDLEDANPVACGCEDFETNGSLPWGVRRVIGHVEWTLRQHDIACVYVEAPYVGPNRQGALNHAMTIGQVVQACDRRWRVPVELVAVSEWKQLCGLSGNATKEQVAIEAVNVGFRSDSQDALDAALIARAGWRLNAGVVAG